MYWPIKSLTRLFEFSSDQNYHLTLKIASAQVFETSVANKSPSQDSSYPDDLNQLTYRLADFHIHTLIHSVLALRCNEGLENSDLPNLPLSNKRLITDIKKLLFD